MPRPEVVGEPGAPVPGGRVTHVRLQRRAAIRVDVVVARHREPDPVLDGAPRSTEAVVELRGGAVLVGGVAERRDHAGQARHQRPGRIVVGRVAATDVARRKEHGLRRVARAWARCRREDAEGSPVIDPGAALLGAPSTPLATTWPGSRSRRCSRRRRGWPRSPPPVRCGVRHGCACRGSIDAPGHGHPKHVMGAGDAGQCAEVDPGRRARRAVRRSGGRSGVRWRMPRTGASTW